MVILSRYMNVFPAILICCLAVLNSCRQDEIVVPPEYQPIEDNSIKDGSISGFYLLNEGNMGSNKASLDLYDEQSGIYARNIYADRNPGVIKELGDVGNDMKIYGSKLYMVINCSHKVEVLDAATGIRLGKIDISNCRYINFHYGKAYVSSYVGPVEVNSSCPRGEVCEIDTASLAITRRVTVGYQPEEIEFSGKYMYVANSGGYNVPDYDNTLSVVDLSRFVEVKQIPVGINLHRVRCDRYGRMWVTSRGDRERIPGMLYRLSREGGEDIMVVRDTLSISCSNLAIKGDSLYFISSGKENIDVESSPQYGILDIVKSKIISDCFIPSESAAKIKMPYALAVNPVNGDIYLSDAKNYVSSGTLYCFDHNGVLKWSVRTGDIPAVVCFF